MRLKKHSEKTEDARPKKEQGKGRGRAAARGKAQPSPASSRNVYSLASHVHANLGPNLLQRKVEFSWKGGVITPENVCYFSQILSNLLD